MFNETNGYVGRLSGFFVAPYSGQFQFSLAASDHAALYLSNTSPPNSTYMIHNENGYNTDQIGQKSDPIQLEEGQFYFIAVVHHQRSTSSAKNYVRIGLSSPTTGLTNDQTSWSVPEEQTIFLKESKRDEIQTVTVNGTISNTFHFTLNGIKTDVLFDLTDPEGNWPDQFEKMMFPKCRYSTDYLDDVVFITSDGDENGKLNGQQGWVRNYNIEAYCGKGVVQDAYIHFRQAQVEIRTYPHLCFAYNGAGLTGTASVNIEYYHATQQNYKTTWFQFTDELEGTEDGPWGYGCWNILEMFDEANPNLRNPAKQIYINRLDIHYSWSEFGHSYIDELRFSKESIEIFREPILPFPSFMPNKIDVKSGEEYDYELRFSQYSCPSERFPLLGVESGTPGNNCTLMEINSNDPMLIKDYLSHVNSTNATFYCTDWPQNTSITIKRDTQMSLAMQGSYSMTFKNQTVNVPIYSDKRQIFPLVDANWNYGCDIVQWANCWEQHFRLLWDCEGGDQPLIEVSADDIITDGTEIDFGVWQNEDQHNGLIHIFTMGPDFFRTVHDSQQVQVVVNDYPAWCADCSYAYDSSYDTEVISIVQSFNNGDINLVITGSGFTDDSDILVDVQDGLMTCIPNSVSASEIDCTISSPEAGNYSVQVFVKSKGQAAGTDSVVIEVPLVISAISPSQGSLGGGIVFNI